MSGLFERILNDQSIVTGMLLVIAVGSLTFAYRHLRPLAGRRQSAHSKTRRAPATARIDSPAHSRGPAADGGRWTGGDPWMTPPPRAAAGHPRPVAGHSAHAEDYPSWPGRPGPGALHPDHPSWPGRPDPRWADAEAAQRADDYPVWDAGSVQLASWILSEANTQAAEIRHEARDQAAASLADAKKEAAELLRQASDQAAAKLAAAESEAAEVQAAVMKLSSEVGEVAANVTARLLSPAD